jgi:predicted lysophospholipase L1 biosynthesis ABC-type transport system permease subunit
MDGEAGNRPSSGGLTCDHASGASGRTVRDDARNSWRTSSKRRRRDRRSGLRRQYEQPLTLPLAITGLVPLIACANRRICCWRAPASGEREIAVRQAIGASRGRLIGQLLSESLLLSVFGTVLGALLAQGLSRGLLAFLAGPGTNGNRWQSPLFVGLTPDLRMLGCVGAVAVTACLLFGLLPAIRATRIAPASVMRGGGRGLTPGRERFGARRLLVVAQLSMSLVLLVGALLFVRSLQKLMSVDAGFRPDGLISVSLDLKRGHYSKDACPGTRNCWTVSGDEWRVRGVGGFHAVSGAG